MSKFIRRLTALALVAAISATALAEDKAETYRKLLDEKSENIVTVRFSQKLRLSMGGRTQEAENNPEVNGFVVSADGLVMLTNLALSPRVGRGVTVTASAPTDIKIRFGNEEEEYDAVLAAVDSQLQLAFMRIKDLKGREVAPATFGEKLEIGQELFALHRHGRGFD